MGEQMEFPKTFDEFAEHYKITDTKQVYTNGIEMIPIFRVKQWLSQPSDVVEVVRCGNCKYFYKGRMGNRCTLSLGLKVPHRDAWCCYGERKES